MKWKVPILIVAALVTILLLVPHDANASKNRVIFHDDYSSSTGWTQVGSEVYISNGHVVISGNDAVPDRIYRPLGTTLSNTTAFKINIDFNFTAATIPADYLIALTNNTNNPDIADNNIGVVFGVTGNELRISWRDAAGNPSTPQSSLTGIPVFANTIYYVTLERLNSTLVKLSAFTDPARTIPVLGSPIFQVIPSEIGKLSIVEHAVAQGGCSCRSMTGFVGHTAIYAIHSHHVK